MKVFGYARRSASESRKASYSIESQKDICNQLAERDGRKIDKFYIDKGYSGTTLQRPNMQKMLRDIAEANEEIYIYIWAASRLSRKSNQCDSLRYVFDKYNVTVVSSNNDWASLQEIEETPDVAIVPRYISINDETEVHRDRKRTIMGLVTSARMGNYTKGGTTAPTGYRFVKNENSKGRKVELDPDFAETMIYILSEIHDKRRSVDSVAIELDASKACGVMWCYSKVYKAVTDPIIYGRFVTSYVDIDNHSPAYCSKDYYDEIQKILHGRKKEVHHKYLFKNIVKCNKCSYWCNEIPTIHYARNGDKKSKRVYKYYYCPNCNKRINEQVLLNKIIYHIEEISISNVNEEIIEDMKNKSKRLEKRLEFIDDEYDNGLLNDDYYKAERKQILAKRKNIDKSVKKMEKEAVKRFRNFTYSEQKQLIEKAFTCIDVNLEEKSISNIVKKISK